MVIEQDFAPYAVPLSALGSTRVMDRDAPALI
jgi:hypothetical protein